MAKTSNMKSAAHEDGARGTLTREDIALAIHRRLEGMSRREAKRLTDLVIEEMAATLASGESLKLHDFGSFIVRTKRERAGRNPRTGAPVPIEARRVITFKASPNMKAAINGADSFDEGQEAGPWPRRAAAGRSRSGENLRPMNFR